jgi:hypothetical protein
MFGSLQSDVTSDFILSKNVHVLISSVARSCRNLGSEQGRFECWIVYMEITRSLMAHVAKIALRRAGYPFISQAIAINSDRRPLIILWVLTNTDTMAVAFFNDSLSNRDCGNISRDRCHK